MLRRSGNAFKIVSQQRRTRVQPVRCLTCIILGDKVPQSCMCAHRTASSDSRAHVERVQQKIQDLWACMQSAIITIRHPSIRVLVLQCQIAFV